MRQPERLTVGFFRALLVPVPKVKPIVDKFFYREVTFREKISSDGSRTIEDIRAVCLSAQDQPMSDENG